MTYGEQSNYTLVAIRGIGSDVTTVAEPSVATYQDGVYSGVLAQQNVPVFDLERIEVLRGPQGTLYGRNADGGVINYITKKPSFDREANVQLRLAEYNHVQVDAGISGPLTDNIAGRLSVRYLEHDPYRDNLQPGQDDFGDQEQSGARASLLFEPNDELSVILRGSYSESEKTHAYQIISSEPVPPFTVDTGEPLPSADPLA